MKTCKKCGVVKNVSEFYKHKRTADGYNSYCKACSIAKTIAWRKTHPHKVAAYQKKWNTNNSEKMVVSTKKWKAANLEKNRATTYAWNKAHPEKANARNSRHRATKLNATPAWANDFFIKGIYALAQRRTKMLGFKWRVDHIVPLRSKLVCGLHVENNLQVIPATQNISKSNRHWPDMPD